MRELRMLIVEDEFLSRRLLQAQVREYGSCDCADDGLAAVRAVTAAYEAGRPYDLVFMDIMLPNADGITALKEIRAYEAARRTPFGEASKVIVVSALNDAATVMDSFKSQCEGYLTKPYSKLMLDEAIAKLGFE